MSNNENHIALFEAKMREEGLSDAAIKAFGSSYAALVSGQSGMIAEDDITPAAAIPYLDNGTEDSIRNKIKANHALLKETVVLKLNGGLGTSMGLDKAKSLLTVKGEDTFLDIMAKQVLHLRETHDSNVRFILMNSFSTSSDTLDYLKKYPTLGGDTELEMMQNKAPKVNAETLEPATWSANPAKEWCPPGHGDLYPSLAGSGTLDALLAQGVKYMFVSNSDNLGATLDMDLLTYFAESDKPFLMECCERTENDKKGGHLATRTSDGQLILRESAQCAKSDEEHFQNITRHRFFNTNNLWVRLDRLKTELEKHGGVMPLPMIKNVKTVDPKDPSSTRVFQLETAMGAAIESFQGAGAVCVPRTRFAPVKKSDDLLMLRSDAYVMTSDFRPVLSTACRGKAPIVSLDSKHYKLVQQLESTISGNSANAIPSLVQCKKLTIRGHVLFSPDVVLRGEVTVVNSSDEPKTLRSGQYDNTEVDLTTEPGLGPFKISKVSTQPIAGQKPGTSGLRQKTRTFMTGTYLHNFVQSVLNALPLGMKRGGTLVISGDGRYYNREAIQIIIKMAVAAGVSRVWIGKDGLLSTPAVSAVIRERRTQQSSSSQQAAFGGFILSASHNPGGIDEDFGIKYNCENGGPAPESVTNAIYENTKTISTLELAADFPDIDLSVLGTSVIRASDDSRSVTIEIFDAAEDHVKLLKEIFDFPAIRQLISRPDFSFRYDSMSGVQGPYARRVFIDELGAPESSLINATPLEDFGGRHADPNLTYAVELTALLGLDAKGQAMDSPGSKDFPDFGAAADGDADRNMILGRQFFVTPSDSLAILAANAHVIPYFASRGGLKGVARSMPTSGALDRVATKLGVAFFEVPTGWKFFGNLMDSKVVYGKEDYTPFICGEESFGTGSNHIREKDGMWAVLAWLSILAEKNAVADSTTLVSVEDIVKAHWAEYGRNYYCRLDYEGVDKSAAQDMMTTMASLTKDTAASLMDNSSDFVLASTDEFTYVDPVDESISRHQGIRFIFEDGSRVVFRLSGTGVAGATIRMYVEKYEPPEGNLGQTPSDALGPLIDIGLRVSKLQERTGRDAPTVIT